MRRVAKRAPRGKYLLELGKVPNYDYTTPGTYEREIESKKFQVTVKDFKTASKTVKQFIKGHRLGSGNWDGGNLTDENGDIVAHVSYNGRVWEGPLGKWPTKEIKAMDKVARELVAVARELTAMLKFTARVSSSPIGNKHVLELFHPLGYKLFDKKGMISLFDRVKKEADAVMKNAAHSLGSKGYKVQIVHLSLDKSPMEFEVTAFLYDDISTPENIVFALEENAVIRSAWVD